MIEITQDDLEAAAAAYVELTGIRTGADQMHGDWLARRFANHRIAAENRMKERAAALADAEKVDYMATLDPGDLCYNTACEHIAEVIRRL